MKKIKIILATGLFSFILLGLNTNQLYAQKKCSLLDKKKCTTNNKEACGPNNTKTHKAQVIQDLEKSYVHLMDLIDEKYPDFSKKNLTVYTSSQDEKLVLTNIDKGITKSKKLFKNVVLKDPKINENKAQQVQRLKHNISSMTEKVTESK